MTKYTNTRGYLDTEAGETCQIQKHQAVWAQRSTSSDWRTLQTELEVSEIGHKNTSKDPSSRHSSGKGPNAAEEGRSSDHLE